MNKEIIQICNITIELKFALKTNTKIEYFPFEYERNIEFLFSKNKIDFLEKNYKAGNIEEWFDYCLNLGLEDIKILLPVSSKNLNIPNDLNSNKIKLICYFKNNLILYFTPKWKKTSGGWNVTYTAHKYENSINEKLKFYDNTEDFKNVLNKIAILADKINFSNFGNIFRKAFSILNGESFENIRNTFYGQTLLKIPEINARLFYSAKISNVFGGMGSWNDSPHYYVHEKGLEIEYDSLTEELLTQIRLALLYSVNEW
ncbi:RNA polymerase subunit sigma [Leptotrichia massiliensis]|uniref:RNA polymerase subunit sigma n=1 Tax=Leptotrichia massiliensis TaxID=1852388 RepID=UPI0008D9F333|nr:RNA polymerase subunit sigma [Leptotrichia massiliensis]